MGEKKLIDGLYQGFQLLTLKTGIEEKKYAFILS